jgi:SAM-dependent methyltransferase
VSSTEHHPPQNVYDDPVFFDGYKNLRQGDTGLNGVLEVPALHALLPDLQGLSVLDLGCGFGDFARHARTEGAASVTAVDVSQRMIAEAIRLTEDGGIKYVHRSIESFSPAPESFELVVSSLALHYVDDYAAVILRVFSSLVAGGHFIFSVEHPICTAHPVGWTRSPDGKQLHWPIDRYHDEAERHTKWFVDGVTKFHRTLETYVNTLVAVGFRLDHLGEPKPSSAALQTRPSLEDTLRRPPFLLLAVTKRNHFL